MWTHTYTHTTDADPARLWALLADVDGWVNWNDGVERIQLDGPVGVGATFRMTPPGAAPLTSTIVAFEPPRLLTDNTELDGIAVRVEHRLDPADDRSRGATVIVYAVTVTGTAPEEVQAEVGAAVSADFPQVMAALAAAASS